MSLRLQGALDADAPGPAQASTAAPPKQSDQEAPVGPAVESIPSPFNLTPEHQRGASEEDAGLPELQTNAAKEGAADPAALPCAQVIAA